MINNMNTLPRGGQRTLKKQAISFDSRTNSPQERNRGYFQAQHRQKKEPQDYFRETQSSKGPQKDYLQETPLPQRSQRDYLQETPLPRKPQKDYLEGIHPQQRPHNNSHPPRDFQQESSQNKTLSHIGETLAMATLFALTVLGGATYINSTKNNDVGLVSTVPSITNVQHKDTRAVRVFLHRPPAQTPIPNMEIKPPAPSATPVDPFSPPSQAPATTFETDQIFNQSIVIEPEKLSEQLIQEAEKYVGMSQDQLPQRMVDQPNYNCAFFVNEVLHDILGFYPWGDTNENFPIVNWARKNGFQNKDPKNVKAGDIILLRVPSHMLIAKTTPDANGNFTTIEANAHGDGGVTSEQRNIYEESFEYSMSLSTVTVEQVQDLYNQYDINTEIVDPYSY